MVRAPWPDELARIDRAFVLSSPPIGTRRSWLWVAVVGEVERIVAVACLHEFASAATAATSDAPARLDLDVREAWKRDPLVTTLVNGALKQAAEMGTAQVSVAQDPNSPVACCLVAAGFVETNRQEIWTMKVEAMRGYFAQRGDVVLARRPVKISPLAEANVDRVRRICGQQHLLTPDRVHVLDQSRGSGFDSRLSFFVGEPAEPAEVLLAREMNGVAYLEVLARNPAAADVPITSPLALLRALVNAVHALGITEISCAIWPSKNPGMASLVRRHGGRLRESKAVFRWSAVQAER